MMKNHCSDEGYATHGIPSPLYQMSGCWQIIKSVQYVVYNHDFSSRRIFKHRI